MLTGFVSALREAGLPVSVTEHLALIGAMRAGVAAYRVEDFYFLSRAVLVKDERYYDRFDVVFGAHFKALSAHPGVPVQALPEEWLRQLAEKLLTPEEMAALNALGFDELMETLRQRLAEQQGRHEGGSKWIGTKGTSPFGAQGYNPAGVRVGQKESRHGRAVKVWDRRDFRELDDKVELGVRNTKLALRKLRRFARTGAAVELDMAGTVRATANNAGSLEIKFVPERHNAVKLLLMLDVGGSMDYHVRETSELFSAVKSEFKHLEIYYFHNCPYETVWRGERGRRETKVSTLELLRTYPPDYRLVFVGDASMAHSEIIMPGGSVEHWNLESGEVWMKRLTRRFPRAAWLNPIAETAWKHSWSIGEMRRLMDGRMHPLTLAGLEAMISDLRR